ncbi:MAG: fasciclin domain-containing protein [Bacteroidota bacterium]
MKHVFLLSLFLLGIGLKSGFAQEVVDFDRSQGQLLKNENFPDIPGPYTVELFFNIEDFSNFPVLWKMTDGNDNNDFTTSFWINESGVLEFWDVRGLARFGPIVDTCQWYHLAYVWDDSTGNVYFDGQLVATHTGRTSVPGKMLRLSGNSDQPRHSFDGQMDEVRISDVARYTEDFTVPSTEFFVDEHTVALYRFEETDGQVVKDLSGNGLDLVLGLSEAPESTDPTFGLAAELSCAGATPVVPAKVSDFIATSADHTTLATALDTADLLATLSGDGPLTVFAPTDTAFSLLPDGTLNSLLTGPRGELTQILQYHLVEGIIPSSSLRDGNQVPTILGQTALVSVSNDSIFINEAYVRTADIETANGVVHVIEGLLLPELVDVKSIPASGLTIKIFPNPTSDLLYIDLSDASIQGADLIIWDLNGKQMLLKRLAQGQHRIDVSVLMQGIYFVELRMENDRVQQPIIIKR